MRSPTVAKLAITPAQEGAWSTWTAAIKPTPHQRPDRAELQSLTTPERIDRMRALRAQRNAEMDRKMDATKVFYASLNGEQKKVFDNTADRNVTSLGNATPFVSSGNSARRIQGQCF